MSFWYGFVTGVFSAAPMLLTLWAFAHVASKKRSPHLQLVKRTLFTLTLVLISSGCASFRNSGYNKWQARQGFEAKASDGPFQEAQAKCRIGAVRGEPFDSCMYLQGYEQVWVDQ